MSVSIPDFWRLALESHLLTQAQCQQLATSFGTSQGASTDVQTLAKWLIAQNVISRYQAKVLLAGRPGPFCYGNYKIYDRDESGRLAGWFRAVHTATNHPVMLKFLAGAAAQDAALWQHIVAFVPLTAHPNLVRCYEAVDLGSYRFLVMEDLRGQTLAERLKTGTLPADEACRITQLAANGLSQLHQSGRPHGDPRPHNFWLETTGNVKVLADPDIPAAAPNLTQADSNGELLAESDYLAPEFLHAGKAPDSLTDIYAVGCSLYESLAGQPPFAGGTVQEKLQRHATEAIQPLESVGVPQAVGQAVAYMMAKNPQVRYQQAADVVQTVGQFVGAAQANHQPAVAPATQQAFETALAQQQAAPAAAAPVAVAQPVAQARPATPAAPAVKTRGPVVATKKPRSGGSGSVTAERQARAKARQKNNIIMFGSAIGVAAVLLIIGVIVLSSMGGNSSEDGTATADVTEQNAADPVQEVAPDEPAADTAADTIDESSDEPMIVDDDGTLLWASPTAGQPIEPRYLPGGARILVALRPAKMLAEPEGEDVLTALGPDFAAARTAWETAAGYKLNDIERLTLTVHPNDGQFPKVCSIVQLPNPASLDAMLSKWGNPAAVDGLASVYQRGAMAYYIPSDGGDQTFVMGPLEPEIRTLVAGETPPLSRDLGRLLRASDDQRHVNIFFDRNFFHTDGSLLFAGQRARAGEQLDWFFGNGVKGGLVSLHFGEPFYFEFRAQNDITTDSQTLVQSLRTRIDSIPQAIEDYLVTVNPPPYWAKIKGRLRDMIYEWGAQTRSGVDLDHAVINSALPAVAAPNLAVAGEMLITLNPGGAVANVTSAAPAPPKNIEELVGRQISLAFGSNDMILAMQELEGTVKDTFRSLPFEFKVTIMGSHLQLEGITKNQRINDFEMTGSLSDVLAAMVQKADKRLVWVIAPDPENASNKIILITTRNSAEGKYTLPEVFRPS